MKHGTTMLAMKGTIKLMPIAITPDIPGQLNVTKRITNESTPSQLDRSTVNRKEVHIRGEVNG